MVLVYDREDGLLGGFIETLLRKSVFLCESSPVLFKKALNYDNINRLNEKT